MSWQARHSLYSLCLLLTGANTGHIPDWSGPDLSRSKPQNPKVLWIVKSWLLGHSSEQNSGWQGLKGRLGCDRQLQDFVKQSDEPSQIEAPNAAQLCNWDGNGPMRGSSLCLTFWESCSRRLCGGRREGRRNITNNKLLCLICNELVINGLVLCESLTITEQL